MSKSDIPPGNKRCLHCRSVKSLVDFYTDRKARDGRRPECKACNLARRAAKYRENPRPYIERVQRWQRDNPERFKQKQREYLESGKKAIANRKHHLKRKYGLTVEEYDAMFTAQGGVCAICDLPRPEERTLHVDHDHETGAVRGLLCFTCNNALGNFRDSSDLFHAAAEYLERDDELVELRRLRALALRRPDGSNGGGVAPR